MTDENDLSPNAGTGLPDSLKAGLDALSGMSTNDAKLQFNSSQPAQLNALAYAQGTDIYVGPGQEQHPPHEAWHVVQQATGRVKPTMQMGQEEPGEPEEPEGLGGEELGEPEGLSGEGPGEPEELGESGELGEEESEV